MTPCGRSSESSKNKVTALFFSQTPTRCTPASSSKTSPDSSTSTITISLTKSVPSNHIRNFTRQLSSSFTSAPKTRSISTIFPKTLPPENNSASSHGNMISSNTKPASNGWLTKASLSVLLREAHLFDITIERYRRASPSHRLATRLTEKPHRHHHSPFDISGLLPSIEIESALLIVQPQ